MDRDFLLSHAQTIIAFTAPQMPFSYWWVTGFVLLLLTLSALIDAFTEIVPDVLILLGLAAVIITEGFFVSWKVAGVAFASALAAGFVIWSINEIWYRKFGRDALGMGDAKWTMLAVACFGFLPALVAWGTGAVLASLCIWVARSRGHDIDRVTFGPFLLVGLFGGLYWLRLMPAG